MTGERLEYILELYKKFLDALDEQNDSYYEYCSDNPTLNVFELSKGDPFKEICQSMHILKANDSDYYNRCRLLNQLAVFYDILASEKSSIRIEKKYHKVYFEYNKLILESINRTKLLIDYIIRS